jgi:hypothetical protein
LWTRRKLSVPARDARRVAFLIARKIGRSGFRGSHMFQRAAERISPIASTRWAALGERLARLGNGTA